VTLPDRVEQPAKLPTPPDLAATGSREIDPVSTAPLRARADALTGIKRADSANVQQKFSTVRHSPLAYFADVSPGESAIKRRISRLML
jgi:hypothetical protein